MCLVHLFNIACCRRLSNPSTIRSRDSVLKIGTSLGTVHFIYHDIWRSFLCFRTLISNVYSRKDPKYVPGTSVSRKGDIFTSAMTCTFSKTKKGTTKILKDLHCGEQHISLSNQVMCVWYTFSTFHVSQPCHQLSNPSTIRSNT